jgi:hypothetical protein
MLALVAHIVSFCHRLSSLVIVLSRLVTLLPSFQTRPKVAQALADPAEYDNLFPDFASSLQAEAYLK